MSSLIHSGRIKVTAVEVIFHEDLGKKGKKEMPLVSSVAVEVSSSVFSLVGTDT